MRGASASAVLLALYLLPERCLASQLTDLEVFSKE